MRQREEREEHARLARDARAGSQDRVVPQVSFNIHTGRARRLRPGIVRSAHGMHAGGNNQIRLRKAGCKPGVGGPASAPDLRRAAAARGAACAALPGKARRGGPRGASPARRGEQTLPAGSTYDLPAVCSGSGIQPRIASLPPRVEGVDVNVLLAIRIHLAAVLLVRLLESHNECSPRQQWEG